MLLGDAAHVNSPLGGLGLKQRASDAVDLSIRLVRILTQAAADVEAELQMYDAASPQVAIQYVQNISTRNTTPDDQSKIPTATTPATGVSQ